MSKLSNKLKLLYSHQNFKSDFLKNNTVFFDNCTMSFFKRGLIRKYFYKRLINEM